MEQKKQKVLKRLKELKSVTFKEPTAMELRSPRPLLSRVDRQEERRHRLILEQQKVKLKDNLKRIESYMESVRKRETYLKKAPELLSEPQSYIKGIGKQETNMERIRQQKAYQDRVRKREAYLMKAPVVLVKPGVEISTRPVFRRTRLERYKPRHERRSVY